jgi:O-antigen/teichoic acid export membrane protein
MAVLGSLYQNIPRFFIERYQGLAAVGYFSAVFYLTYVGYTLVSALGSATSPRLARLFAEDGEQFSRMTMTLVLLGGGIGAAGTVAALVAGRWMLGILYRAEYSQYHSLFVWVMVSSTFWYMATLLIFAGIAAKLFRPQAYLHATATLITLALCPWLLRDFGLSGAAIALTAGVAALLVGEGILVYRAVVSWRPGSLAPPSEAMALDGFPALPPRRSEE